MCAAVRERKKTLSNTRSYTAISRRIYFRYIKIHSKLYIPASTIFNLNPQRFVLKFHRFIVDANFFQIQIDSRSRVQINIDIILKETNVVIKSLSRIDLRQRVTTQSK